MDNQTKVEVTARLEKAMKVKLWGRNVVLGFIYEDRKGRFEAGRFVHTSTVRQIDGDIVFTKNSVYKVEWATEDDIKAMQDKLDTIGATVQV